MQICPATVANSSSLRNHGHAKTNHLNSWSAGMELISVIRSETLVTTFDHIHLQSGLSLLSSHLNWVCSSYSLRYVDWSTLKKKRRDLTDQKINFCCIFSLVIYHHWYEKVCTFFSIVIIFSLEGLFLSQILVFFFVCLFFYCSKQNIVGMVYKKSS